MTARNVRADVAMTFDALVAAVTGILERSGCLPAVAAPIGRSLAACERDGTPSHGLLRLPGLVEAVRSGWVDGCVLPEVISESASMRVVDARNGFSHLALEQSREPLEAMARETGAGILLIRHAHHHAALWPDIEAFARNGFVALSCVTSRARMAGWGGGRAVFGTNASAFACPRTGADPVVWDQSTSVMSQGDVLIAARDGRRLPEGVGVDSVGRSTTDPHAVLDGGALLPFGGHKGASIAFAVEILASALSGSAFGFESPAAGMKPSQNGQFVMLVDPRRAGVDLPARAEDLLRAVIDAGSAQWPGARRYALRAEAARSGILLAPAARQVLESLAA